jgi:hypothetical protein
MLARLPNAVAVGGPTDLAKCGRSPKAARKHGNERTRRITISPGDTNLERVQIDDTMLRSSVGVLRRS